MQRSNMALSPPSGPAAGAAYRNPAVPFFPPGGWGTEFRPQETPRPPLTAACAKLCLFIVPGRGEWGSACELEDFAACSALPMILAGSHLLEELRPQMGALSQEHFVSVSHMLPSSLLCSPWCQWCLGIAEGLAASLVVGSTSVERLRTKPRDAWRIVGSRDGDSSR